MLLEAHPEAARIQDKYGSRLPLYFAIRYKAAPDVVKMLLEAYPEATRIQNIHGQLPLHIAYHSWACLEVLHLLSKAYPDSIDLLDYNNKKSSYCLRLWARQDVDCQGNNDHMDLLNNAVINGFSVYLVKLLLEALPGQCMTRDGNGMTLLHHACANAAAAGSLEVVMTLLEVNPETSTIVDNHGKTPSDLLQQVASQRNENGMYPLHHHAARGLLTVNSLRLLFNAHPESIALPDKHGMLPFHHAALNNASSLDVLKLFVTLYPESILFNF
jgi:ankyrin repeat protein